MRTIEETAVAAAEYQPVTQAEAEALIRHVNRTCRGKAVLPVDRMRELHAAWDKLSAEGNWFGAYDFCIHAEEDVNVVGPRVENDDWEALGRRTLGAIYAHGDTIGKPCGADFNDQIIAHPFDGEQRSVQCPKCGSVNVFTSPVFVISD
jgi:hypothetical protein